ncbi:hypothetical protein TTRE_0000457701 [Trichuris trichiura]|uniref:DUF7083 domain-containing protein n=1 Tax=Trichuris trichiura TaxID=36087 RepID=A0A077Z7W0_TRITR|nr:hypothetical protein TTRE_0000457701 [Trichuris trichiura]
MDAHATSVMEFEYDPDNSIAFETCFQRFEGVFTVDCATPGDKAKVRFLRGKLMVDVVNRYPRVRCSRIGLRTQAKATLLLKAGVRPIFRSRRPVAFTLLPGVDRELDCLERNGILSKVNYSN